MHNGIRPSQCTCIMTRAPKGWGSYNGPEPAEWEQDPLCFEHPGDPGSILDPIQSAPIGWREPSDDPVVTVPDGRPWLPQPDGTWAPPP